MSEKIIDEVMELVDAYAAMQGVDTYDQQVDAHDAIRAKLREVLERKPISKEKFERMESAAYAATRGKGKTTFEYAENLKNRIEKYHHIGAE